MKTFLFLPVISILLVGELCFAVPPVASCDMNEKIGFSLRKGMGISARSVVTVTNKADQANLARDCTQDGSTYKCLVLIDGKKKTFDVTVDTNNGLEIKDQGNVVPCPPRAEAKKEPQITDR